MKKLFTFLLLAATFAASAQTQYESFRDGDSKILKGIITRSLLTSDTAFSGWYASNAKISIPSAESVERFKKLPTGTHFVVFGGTWCHDTQQILPRFYNLLDAAGVSENLVTLIGMDRQKKTLGAMEAAFKITNVPTIIVMKDGKELSRIVEYGKYGLVDKELDEIIAGIK